MPPSPSESSPVERGHFEQDPFEQDLFEQDRPVTLPRAAFHDIPGPDGRPMRIFLGWPAEAEADPGLALRPLLCLDGNIHFGRMLEMARALAGNRHVLAAAPALVVGIGYPGVEGHDAERRALDYTPAIDTAHLGARPDGLPWERTGGAEAFLDWIEARLMPFLAARFALAPDQAALFGHSFGGLFTLHAAFTRPGLFRRYCASSPSIWFGGQTVLRGEAGFAARLAACPSPRQLLLSVGAAEEDAFPGADQARKDWLARNRMVGNARSLAGRLAALPPGLLASRFHEFAGENHLSAAVVATIRAVELALLSPSSGPIRCS